MQVNTLLGLNWKNHIPDLQGRLEGNDLDNLKEILKRKEDFTEGELAQFKSKCINFTESLKTGLEYVKAMQICEPILESTETRIIFKDGEEKVPDSFWSWVSTLTNLKSIDLPKSCTVEQFNKLPLSIEGIGMNKCIHFDDSILDHPEKMPLKRVLLHSAPDTQYPGSIEHKFSEECLKRVQDKAKIL